MLLKQLSVSGSSEIRMTRDPRGIFHNLSQIDALNSFFTKEIPAMVFSAPLDFSEQHQKACAMLFKKNVSPFITLQIERLLRDDEVASHEGSPHFAWIKNLRAVFEQAQKLSLTESTIELTSRSLLTLLNHLENAQALVTNRTFHKDIPFDSWYDFENQQEIFKRCLDFLTPQEVTLLETVVSKMTAYKTKFFIGRRLDESRPLVKLWKSFEDNDFFRRIRQDGFCIETIQSFQKLNAQFRSQDSGLGLESAF